jgi:signal transduction histidine kinase
VVVDVYARAVPSRRSDDQLWPATVLVAVAVLLAGAEVAIYLSCSPAPRNGTETLIEMWQYVTQGVTLAVAGFLVLARRSAPAIGWLLLGPAEIFLVAACLSTWLRFAVVVTPGARVAVYAEYALWEVPRLAFVLLPLLFPAGRLLPGWPRVAAVAMSVILLVEEALALLALPVWNPGAARIPNALFQPALAAAIGPYLPTTRLVVYLAVLATAASPFAYWSTATGRRRRQILVVGPVFAAVVIVEGLRQTLHWSPWVAGGKVALGVIGPAAMAYTIVRDRLWELDRAARRIIAIGMPLVLLAAVYAAATVAAVLLPFSAALALLAAVAGLVLRPAARWVQRGVDRLLYGDRAEPYQLARRLAGHLPDAASVPLAICQIVVTAMRLPAAALTAADVGGDRLLARVGDGTPEDGVELRYQGRLVGHLLVAPRAGDAVLDERDRAALGPLADVAAPAVSAILLSEELSVARAQERQRLRRDVHDSVGPSLAAVRLQVDTAVALLPGESPSRDLLIRASDELGEAVAEMRRVTEDVRPPVLDAGLAAALRDLTARLGGPARPITLDLPARPPELAPAVELAAYRITAEALANAIKHAGPARVAVSVTVTGDRLRIEIADDGAGLRPGPAGVGLESMARRAAEVGGECVVTGGPGGTTVRASLPV